MDLIFTCAHAKDRQIDRDREKRERKKERERIYWMYIIQKMNDLLSLFRTYNKKRNKFKKRITV